MAYKRKKGGQALMEMSRKSGQRKRATAKKLRDQVRRNVAAGSKTPAQRASSKAAVTKRGGTTITYKPKPSPHLKPATKKVAKKAAPKSVVKKAAPKAVAKKATPKKKSLTPAQRLANDQRRKNLRSEIEGRFKGDKITWLGKKLGSLYGKDPKNMTHLDEAEIAGKAAKDLATLIATGGAFKAAGGAKKIGGGIVKGVKATGRGAATGARATGRAVATGAKATGRAAVTGAKATKRAARIARVAAKKADRKLLKAQGLSRQGGKVRKIKEPNPFGKNAAKGSKPKPKAKSGKKNPFAGSDKPKPAARKAKKAAQQDAHIKARRADRVKKGKRKADEARKDAVASNKRAAEKAKALRVEKGYAQQRIDARKASRNRRRKS